MISWLAGKDDLKDDTDRANRKPKENGNQQICSNPSCKTVIVFSPPKFMLDLPDLGDVPIRQIEYNEG